MRICIDGRMLATGGTGVATYARTMVASLRSTPANLLILDALPDSPRATFLRFLAAMRRGPRVLEQTATGFARRDVFREAQVHFDIHGTLLELEAPGPAGVMHWTYPVPLHLRGWRNIYTIHDVIPLDPGAGSPINPRRHRRMLDRIGAAADRIVTVSKAARRDICDALGWREERVVNCYQATDVEVHVGRTPPPSLEPGGYFLFVGSLETRKNLIRLIEAHAASDSRRPLVLLGPDGAGVDAIVATMRGRPNLIRLDYQPRETVLDIIAGARALLFPSLAEGFGLPVVEAMALGVPVLASAGGALEEIAGGAALLVDPRDVGDIAGGIARIDTDSMLRAELSARGDIRARNFSPAAFAERLLALYGCDYG